MTGFSLERGEGPFNLHVQKDEGGTSLILIASYDEDLFIPEYYGDVDTVSQQDDETRDWIFAQGRGTLKFQDEYTRRHFAAVATWVEARPVGGLLYERLEVGNPEGSVRIIAFKEIKSERWISAQSGTVPEYMKTKFEYDTTHSGREYPILHCGRKARPQI